MKIESAVVCVLLAQIATVASADTVIPMSDRGWFASTGYHSATNQNGFTGYSTSTVFGTVPFAQHEYRSFHLFDLGDVFQPATAAALALPVTAFFGGAVTINIAAYQFDSDPALLGASYTSGDAAGQMLFADLGGGSMFGSTAILPNQNGYHAIIHLNGIGLNAVNAGGTFVLGLTMTSATPLTAADRGVQFGQSSLPRTHLHLAFDGHPLSGLPQAMPVPLPPAALGGLALTIAIAAANLRRRRHAPK